MKREILIASYCFYLFVFPATFGAEQSKQNTNVNTTIKDPNSGVAKKYVDIGDAYFYYEIAGNGTPVLLINSDSNDNELFFELAKNHSVVRYDLRGYGKTDKPLAGENFVHAEDLHKLMWFLGIRKAHLVGLSAGVFVGIDFVQLYPKQVISLSIEDVNENAVKETDADALLFNKAEYAHKQMPNTGKIHASNTHEIIEFINSKEK